MASALVLETVLQALMAMVMAMVIFLAWGRNNNTAFGVLRNI